MNGKIAKERRRRKNDLAMIAQTKSYLSKENAITKTRNQLLTTCWLLTSWGRMQPYESIKETKLIILGKHECFQGNLKKMGKNEELHDRSDMKRCIVTRTGNWQEEKTAWHTTNIVTAVKEKNSVWRAYLATRNIREHIEYKEKRPKIEDMMKKAKKKTWIEFGEKLT